jgi:biopolymer transport protein ExbD
MSLQSDGQLFLNQEPVAMDSLLQRLISLRTDDPDLNVIVRGDALTHYKGIRAVLDICQKANLPKVDLATEIAK